MAIAKLWAKWLKKNERNWEDVPEVRQEDVKELLKADVEAGEITAKRYKEITGEKYV